MTEDLAPRVSVALPGGRVIAGRLHTRRRDADGQWWYEVSIEVPAAAVRPIEGEDYDRVPTERAEGKDWVFQALPNDTPERRSLILHRPDCWAAAKGRLTPATSSEAKLFLRHGWAITCDGCKPEPPAQSGNSHAG
ncbi:DUF6233 domain-containing protein [Streptomyces sp. NPDC087263]|uniref:DUF6233 domain-containing protein n=1 Tax=Streptomyces sp. NPDC087263 TaxID=3365773 RepID=UPI003821CE0B